MVSKVLKGSVTSVQPLRILITNITTPDNPTNSIKRASNKRRSEGLNSFMEWRTTILSILESLITVGE